MTMGKPLFLVTTTEMTSRHSSSNVYTGQTNRTPMWKVGLMHGFFPGVGVDFFFENEDQAGAFSKWTLYDPGQILDELGHEEYTVRRIKMYKVPRPDLYGYQTRNNEGQSWYVELEGRDRNITWKYPTEPEARGQFREGRTYTPQDMFGTLPSMPSAVAEELAIVAGRARDTENAARAAQAHADALALEERYVQDATNLANADANFPDAMFGEFGTFFIERFTDPDVPGWYFDLYNYKPPAEGEWRTPQDHASALASYNLNVAKVNKSVAAMEVSKAKAIAAQAKKAALGKTVFTEGQYGNMYRGGVDPFTHPTFVGYMKIVKANAAKYLANDWVPLTKSGTNYDSSIWLTITNGGAAGTYYIGAGGIVLSVSTGEVTRKGGKFYKAGTFDKPRNGQLFGNYENEIDGNAYLKFIGG